MDRGQRWRGSTSRRPEAPRRYSATCVPCLCGPARLGLLGLCSTTIPTAPLIRRARDGYPWSWSASSERLVVQMQRRSLLALSATVLFVLGGAGVAYAVSNGDLAKPNHVVTRSGPAVAELISAQQAAAIIRSPSSASIASVGKVSTRGLGSVLRYLESVHHRGHRLAAHVASSFGCNKDVCIKLNGRGLHLNYWQVIGYVRGGCHSGQYYAPYSRYQFSTPTRCGGAGYYVGQENDIDFSGNIQVCNTVTFVPGKPCEEVHR